MILYLVLWLKNTTQFISENLSLLYKNVYFTLYISRKKIIINKKSTGQSYARDVIKKPFQNLRYKTEKPILKVIRVQKIKKLSYLNKKNPCQNKSNFHLYVIKTKVYSSKI